MIRKTALALMGAASLWATSAFSLTTYVLVPGIAAPYELPPKEPCVFVNPLMWPVRANCTVRSSDEENPVTITVLHRSGTLDDVLLSSGDTLQIIFHNGTKFRMSGEAGAKAELINHGEHTLTAICTT